MRRNLTRREWLTAAGSASLLGFAGMAQADSHTLSDVPVVESADRPTMGTDSSNPTATVYGNFKCPVTQGFVHGNLQTIVDEFVRTGQLNIEFANLAYNPGSTSSYYISSSDPRLAAFGRALWDQQPGNYWSFFEEMFADRVSGYLEYSDIANEASTRGVSNASSAASSASEYESVADSVSSSAASDGVSWIPTLVLAGDATSPHHSTQGVLNFIDARVDDAPSGTTTEQTSTESDSTDESDESDEPDESDAEDESSDDSSSEEETESQDDSANEEETSDDSSSSDDSESEESDDSGSSEESTSTEDESSDDSGSEESDDSGSDDSGSDDSGSSEESTSTEDESSDDSDDEPEESQVESTSDTEEEDDSNDGGSCIIRDGIFG